MHMPLFEYRCERCAHLEEVLQKHTDPAPDACPACGERGTMVKAISLTSFQLKGGGWYQDLYSSSSGKPDSGANGSSTAAGASAARPAESKASEGKPSESKPTESKPSESKPSTSKPTESKASESKPASASTASA